MALHRWIVVEKFVGRFTTHREGEYRLTDVDLLESIVRDNGARQPSWTSQ